VFERLATGWSRCKVERGPVETGSDEGFQLGWVFPMDYNFVVFVFILINSVVCGQQPDVLKVLFFQVCLSKSCLI
jgi:hypothetical protein